MGSIIDILSHDLKNTLYFKRAIARYAISLR